MKYTFTDCFQVYEEILDYAIAGIMRSPATDEHKKERIKLLEGEIVRAMQKLPHSCGDDVYGGHLIECSCEEHKNDKCSRK